MLVSRPCCRHACSSPLNGSQFILLLFALVFLLLGAQTLPSELQSRGFSSALHTVNNCTGLVMSRQSFPPEGRNGTN